MSKKSNRLVFSTDSGRMCPDCEHAIDDCVCKKDSVPEGDGIVRLLLETKGRKGKGVTVITGLLLAEKDLKALGKELKKKCGVGGSIKNHNIEIQGDHRELLINLLKNKGYKVKKSGG